MKKKHIKPRGINIENKTIHVKQKRKDEKIIKN